jgi:hypothetical protein
LSWERGNVAGETTIRLLFTGPVTRSTAVEIPDRSPECLLNDAIHWAYCWQFQLGRLCNSVNDELRHFSDGDWRYFSRTSFDEHMLMVTGGHVVRALSRLQDHESGLSLPAEIAAPLKELRDVYEHWEEQREAFRTRTEMQRSGKKFVENNPTGKPWEVVFHKDDVVFARVVSARRVNEELAKLETVLRDELDKLRTRVS